MYVCMYVYMYIVCMSFKNGDPSGVLVQLELDSLMQVSKYVCIYVCMAVPL